MFDGIDVDVGWVIGICDSRIIEIGGVDGMYGICSGHQGLYTHSSFPEPLLLARDLWTTRRNNGSLNASGFDEKGKVEIRLSTRRCVRPGPARQGTASVLVVVQTFAAIR